MGDKAKKRFGRQPRLLVMIFMTTSFFLVEIVVGYITGSLALVADSFHMLSDIIALIVAFFAIRMGKKKTANKKNSYGWQRAETWGALVNGVFLLALCFTIVVEAIQRFFEVTEIKDPKLVLIVGGVGLAINLVGLLMFAGVGGHGHSHGGGGGHGHSHGGAGGAKKGGDHGHSHAGGSGDHGHSHAGGSGDHGHSHAGGDEDHGHSRSGSSVSLMRMDSENGTAQAELRLGETYKVRKDYTPSKAGYLTLKRGDDIFVLENIKPNVYLGRVNGKEEGRIRTKHLRVPEFDLEDTADLQPEDLDAEMPDLEVNVKKQTGGHNMRAAFLHVLGDALGSVGVIVASLIIWLTDVSWRFYFDPIISLLITGLIIYSTVPLVIDTSLIMLQGVPGFDFDNLRNSLKKLPGVKGVHEVHVWRLSDNNMVGSAHLMVENPKIRDRVSAHAKRVFHLYEVHSSTIQTEVLEANKSRSMLQVRELEDHSESACLLSCEKGCEEDGCCPKGEEFEVATA